MAVFRNTCIDRLKGVVFLILVTASYPLYSESNHSRFAKICDSIEESRSGEIIIERWDTDSDIDKRYTYIAAACGNIQCDFETLSRNLLNFSGFADMFKYISSVYRINESGKPSNPLINTSGSRLLYFPEAKTNYFAAAKASMVKMWGIGRIDSVRVITTKKVTTLNPKTCRPDSIKRIDIYVSATDDTTLIEKWSKGHDKPFVIDTKDLKLRASLIRKDKELSRFQIAGRASPEIRIPKWILKLGGKIFIPRFFDDLENSCTIPN